LDDLNEYINAIGLNIFIPYTFNQLSLKTNQAYKLEYYWKILKTINDRSIKIYAPELYERSPSLLYVTKNQSITLEQIKERSLIWKTLN